MKANAKILPAVILIGAVGLLQVHGIEFWTRFVGPMGWAWSLLLELVALWLWYQGNAWKRWTLGLITSALLLVGPLYLVTAPLFEGMAVSAQAETARAMEMDILKRGIEQDEKDLATYRRNSEARRGWLPAIERAQANIMTASARLVELARAPGQAARPWQQQAVILMQAVALVLFQVSAVMAISMLARRGMETMETGGCHTRPFSRSLMEPMETRRETVMETARETETLMETGIAAETVEEIVRRLDAHLEADGISQRTFAETHGYSTRDLSLVRNHERNIREQRRTAPEHVIRRLGKQFEVVV